MIDRVPGMAKSLPQLKIVNRLHVLRAERRMTQERLAKEIGVTRATVVAIEGGDYNPSLELAFRIAHYFKADINTIFSIAEGTR
jgi:putative transcriptional regulator